MTERTIKKKITQVPSFETPNEGDRILITSEDHRSSWHGPFIYRKLCVDPANGQEVHGACIYSETWQEHGKFAYAFARIEFWCRWEGETLEVYAERKKKIEADFRREGIPIDPIDSFIGENAIQGEWSKPKIGPAFRLERVVEDMVRPKNGELVEVQVRGLDSIQRGRYLAEADMIYSEERLIERRTVMLNQFTGLSASSLYPAVHAALTGEGVQGGQVETQYSERFRYGPPKHPFSEWIRFRSVDRDLQPE